MAGQLSGVEPLDSGHDLSPFSCGRHELDDWLRDHALANHESGHSKTYVVHHSRRVVGFYSLAPFMVGRETVPRPLQRNAPDPISVILLGRLAVDSDWQGQRLGEALLKDAILRAYAGARELGGRAVLVQAKDETAKDFYLRYNFEASPTEDLQLFLRVEDIAAVAGYGET